MKFSKTAGALLLAGALAVGACAKTEHDPDTGLIVDAGMEEVKANCTVCHSSKFILLQKGDRDTWLAMIRWMQKTQGLWQFDEKTEEAILTYLAKNYPPGEVGRRPNLGAALLPPNPYEAKN